MPADAARIAAARQKISGLKKALDEIGPAPDDVPGMLDSANLHRQISYLEKADAIKSETVSACGEYAAMLESALKEIAADQRELASMARQKAGPGKAGARKAARPKKAAGAGAARRKKPARPAKAARVRKAAPRRRR